MKSEGIYKLTQQQFDELFDGAVSFTTMMLNDKPNHIAPMLTVLVAADNVKDRHIMAIAIAVDFNTWEQKEAIMTKIGGQLAEQKHVALAAVLISEAWISTELEKMPRESSNRREAIVIAGTSADRELQKITVQPVRRFEDGDHGPMSAEGEPHTTLDADFPLLRPFFRANLIL